ncbi:MAG TPA: SDR family oxidoreductase, partial [Mycobacteriales bacterium]|nr:SDR family oxidoreductase [Mycobacteriales bacterium]
AIAEALSVDGWRVAAVGRRADRLAEVARLSSSIEPIPGDLSSVDDVERVAARVTDLFGTLNLLVCNAGATHHGPQTTVADVAEHWSRTMASNVLSAVLLEHALRPCLVRPGGRVVVTSSFAAQALAGNAAYGASKAALERWVLALGDEIGAIGGTANAVAPGFVPETELIGTALAPERLERIEAGIAVRRAGATAEIASVVRWLASPESSFVNGAVIPVDGGARRRD